ncbi:MAG: 16S rRNA (adenine(1518)-N(6)/adenine(1519)-N(6))-dimethyltransferase RsmA [Candidatus Omnitrophota bacterium]
MTKHSSSQKHVPKKSLGQNFLIDQRIRNKIIDACQLEPDDTVLEIGPGKGVLSKPILPLVKNLILVEKDRELFDLLKNEFSGQTVDLVCSDILKYPVPDLPQKIILLGNIPYNISTPILEYAILNRAKIKSFFMTVQLEFGQRLSAQPGTKDYGALTCFAQFYADVRLLFKIKNTCFSPAPKVQSCFVRLDFLKRPRYAVQNDEKFLSFIKNTFSKRRKTIANSLALNEPKQAVIELLEDLGLDERLRAENLSLEDFVRIYRKGMEG